MPIIWMLLDGLSDLIYFLDIIVHSHEGSNCCLLHFLGYLIQNFLFYSVFGGWSDGDKIKQTSLPLPPLVLFYHGRP